MCIRDRHTEGILNITEAIGSLENLRRLNVAMAYFSFSYSLPLPRNYSQLKELKFSLKCGWGLQIRTLVSLFEYISKAQNLTKFSLGLDRLEMDSRKEFKSIPFFHNLHEFTLEFKGSFISQPTMVKIFNMISYAVLCLKKKVSLSSPNDEQLDLQSCEDHLFQSIFQLHTLKILRLRFPK
eukprot:TRINITY_DN10976_c0_g1_i1.p1 TRINITY_DN10976_c0_g1~~TRINITY_DN10976_c0_g1_i1.p1  ORF type:complete len:200 (-),score=13.88 TRINITY_DN10976_c0_g1_i1:497-1039(-)